jgi:two-component sensor histidine kinase
VREHAVKSFVNVNILGDAVGPSYGILEVDCLERRDFSQDDINFLRTYANLLAVVIQRRKAGAELQRRAEENERLLKELQHRIKNNLQILTSLVNFQSRRSADAVARDELSKVGQRITALSLVHEKLYRLGQVESIELGSYLGDIARPLLRLYEESAGTIRLVHEAEWIEAPPELAITLGLVTNEFVTNSLKYAFGDRGGTIGIELKKQEEGSFSLELWDDGKGIASSAPRGSGMDLIEALARPIASELEWSARPSVRLKMLISKPERRG